MMKKTITKIWFVGDVGPASVEYTSMISGTCRTRQENILISQALDQFPTAQRVEIEFV